MIIRLRTITYAKYRKRVKSKQRYSASVHLAGVVFAAVVELADTRDLKSLGRDIIRVRIPSAAPKQFEGMQSASPLSVIAPRTNMSLTNLFSCAKIVYNVR